MKKVDLLLKMLRAANSIISGSKARRSLFRLNYGSVLVIVFVFCQFVNNCDSLAPAYASYWITVPCQFGKKSSRGRYSSGYKRVYLLGWCIQPILHLEIIKSERIKFRIPAANHRQNEQQCHQHCNSR